MPRMLRSMTSSALGGWLAYSAVRPFGARRADLRASVVARTVAAGTLTRKDGRQWSVEDFGLVRDERAPKGWKAAKARLAMYFGAHNEAVKAGAKPSRPRKA